MLLVTTAGNFSTTCF